LYTSIILSTISLNLQTQSSPQSSPDPYTQDDSPSMSVEPDVPYTDKVPFSGGRSVRYGAVRSLPPPPPRLRSPSPPSEVAKKRRYHGREPAVSGYHPQTDVLPAPQPVIVTPQSAVIPAARRPVPPPENMNVQSVDTVDIDQFIHTYDLNDPRFVHTRNEPDFSYDGNCFFVQVKSKIKHLPIIASTLYRLPHHQSVIWNLWQRRSLLTTWYSVVSTTRALGPHCFHYIIQNTSYHTNHLQNAPQYKCLWCNYCSLQPPCRYLFMFSSRRGYDSLNAHFDDLIHQYGNLPACFILDAVLPPA
jgi:hypothetical protein